MFSKHPPTSSADDCIAPETITEIIEQYSDEPPSALVLYLYLLARDRANDQPPSQRSIADRTGLNVATVRDQLGSLEDDGYVTHNRNSKDLREKLYRLASLDIDE